MTNAIAALKESADQYESALAKASANDGSALEKRSPQDEALNKLLYTSERKLTSDAGLLDATGSNIRFMRLVSTLATE